MKIPGQRRNTGSDRAQRRWRPRAVRPEPTETRVLGPAGQGLGRGEAARDDTGEELGRTGSGAVSTEQLDAPRPTGHDATPDEFEEHVGGEEEAEANATRPCRGDRFVEPHE
jgi:hypothetical protein